MTSSAAGRVQKYIFERWEELPVPPGTTCRALFCEVVDLVSAWLMIPVFLAGAALGVTLMAVLAGGKKNRGDDE